VVAVPASTSGKPSVTTMVSGLRDGVTHQVLAQSDPLLVPAGPAYHSADTDRNSRISLLELTRVIELYGTRSAQVRTGAYIPDVLGEDGFAPDLNRASGVVAIPSNPHTADFNRDGHPDVAAGRFIWQGPDFAQRVAYAPERDNKGGMTKMGAVKTAAPSKDGVAVKGKTKGKMITMKMGGKAC